MASQPDCLFCKLVREGEHVNAGAGFVAIEDINPKAPVHLLVLPERHVDTFRNVGEFEADYTLIDSDGPVLWFRTNKDAPRGRVVAIDTRHPEPGRWKELIPQADETLQSVDVVADRFLAVYLKDAHTQVKVFELDGTFVREVEFPGLGAEFSPASQVFGLAQGIQLDLGEAGGLLQVRASVVTRTPEEAQSVAAVIYGVIGLGHLASGEFGEAAELVQGMLRSLRVNAIDNEVTLDFQYSVSSLLSTIQAIEQATEDEELDEDADEVEEHDEVRVEKRVEKRAEKHDGRREHRDG